MRITTDMYTTRLFCPGAALPLARSARNIVILIGPSRLLRLALIGWHRCGQARGRNRDASMVAAVDDVRGIDQRRCRHRARNGFARDDRERLAGHVRFLGPADVPVRVLAAALRG